MEGGRGWKIGYEILEKPLLVVFLKMYIFRVAPFLIGNRVTHGGISTRKN